MPRSIGHTWWCVHLWDGQQRPWCQHHKPVQCSPKRKTHFQQWQMLHQTRLHGILWWCVLSHWILTRSRKDPRHHRDDTPSNKTGTTIIFRSSKVSSNIRPPLQSSHWTTMCTSQKVEQLHMGWKLKHKLPENQIPTGESIAETPQVLWQKETSHPPVWCFTQGTQSLHHSRWSSHSFCEQVSHRHRDTLCQHQQGTPSHCVQLWEVPHLPVSKNIYSWNRPQTAGDDKYEKSHCSPSQATENASLTAAVWHDHHVQTRQGNAPGWYPQPSSFTD